MLCLSCGFKKRPELNLCNDWLFHKEFLTALLIPKYAPSAKMQHNSHSTWSVHSRELKNIPNISVYIGSRKCLGKKNPHNFCNVIDIWVVLSKGNLYSRVDLEKKIINKSKIDKPFLFIITKMVPFVTGGFFFQFNLIFCSVDGCISNSRKKLFHII